MKSTEIIVVVMSLLLTTGAIAQTKVYFGGGPKLGINRSMMSYKEVVNERELQKIEGFVGGVFVELMIGKHFGIQPEVLFSQTGINIVDGRVISGLNNRYQRFNYLCIPIEIKYKFHGFGIYVGPQLNFLKRAHDVTPPGNDLRMDYDIITNFKTEEVTGIAGIEYMLPFGLGFNFRYQKGFKNIVIPDGSLERSKTQELYNDLLQFTLSYRFGKRMKD